MLKLVSDAAVYCSKQRTCQVERDKHGKADSANRHSSSSARAWYRQGQANQNEGHPWEACQPTEVPREDHLCTTPHEDLQKQAGIKRTSKATSAAIYYEAVVPPACDLLWKTLSLVQRSGKSIVKGGIFRTCVSGCKASHPLILN